MPVALKNSTDISLALDLREHAQPTSEDSHGVNALAFQGPLNVAYYLRIDVLITLLDGALTNVLLHLIKKEFSLEEQRATTIQGGITSWG